MSLLVVFLLGQTWFIWCFNVSFHLWAESWCEPLDTDTLVEGGCEPIDEPSSPAAEYPNSSEHSAAGKVELTHSPKREDGELVEIQDAKVPQKSADPSAPSTPASDVTGKQSVNWLR